MELAPLCNTPGEIKVSELELDFSQRIILAEPVPVEHLHHQGLGGGGAGWHLDTELSVDYSLSIITMNLELEAVIEDGVGGALDNFRLRRRLLDVLEAN